MVESKFDPGSGWVSFLGHFYSRENLMLVQSLFPVNCSCSVLILFGRWAMFQHLTLIMVESKFNPGSMFDVLSLIFVLMIHHH
jgi:hypothetical protein